MNDTETTTALAQDAYEAVREINHVLTGLAAVPAPLLYDVLGSLKQLGPALHQALTQLGEGLQKSLEVYDVYEDNGADPTFTAARSRQYLDEAAALAQRLGLLLEEAQSAITYQGYRTPQE
jgi:hypothetical protein